MSYFMIVQKMYSNTLPRHKRYIVGGPSLKKTVYEDWRKELPKTFTQLKKNLETIFE